MNPHAGERREALCAWLTANNINPNSVPLDSDLYIEDTPEGRRIHHDLYLLDDQGHKFLDVRGNMAARERASTPLLVEPPDWWEPYIKPSRDELLDAVGRVLGLHNRNEYSGRCDHCSERDYPDYEVAWPCPTVRALGDIAP